MFTQHTEEVPDEEAQADESQISDESKPEASPEKEETFDNDEDVIVEEVEEGSEKAEKKKEVKMKTVTVDEWLHLNSNPPLWVRYAKNNIYCMSKLTVLAVTRRPFQTTSTNVSMRLPSVTTKNHSLGIISLVILGRVYLSRQSSLSHPICPFDLTVLREHETDVFLAGKTNSGNRHQQVIRRT